MSLLSSIFIGTSGLSGTGQDLTTIGDNVSNSTTIGFKAARSAFEELLGQSVAGGVGELGLGVRLQAVQKINRQGSLNATGLATDLAVQGNGYFMVDTGGGIVAYTRNGQATISGQGILTTLDGLPLMGRSADEEQALRGELGPLKVADITAPPAPTDTLTVYVNLDSRAKVGPPFDINDPIKTSNFLSTVTIYDSVGRSSSIDVYYRKETDGQWEWHVVTDGENQEGGTAGIPVEIASGTMSFDDEGRLVDVVTTLNDFSPPGAVQPQPIDFNFGDPLSEGGTGIGGTTQFANPSTIAFYSQDGFPSGSLANFRINDNGQVTGVFTNGKDRLLGEIAIANFTAPDRLERSGNNLMRATQASGEPSIGTPGQGGRGIVVSGSLEASNVDLAYEFIRMIVTQRSFQANSKTVTTVDQLLNELINLKR